MAAEYSLHFPCGRSAASGLRIEERVVGSGTRIPVAHPGYIALGDGALGTRGSRTRRSDVLKAIGPSKRRRRIRAAIARCNGAVDAQRGVDSVFECRLQGIGWRALGVARGVTQHRTSEASNL